jgi:hypothetical protein
VCRRGARLGERRTEREGHFEVWVFCTEGSRRVPVSFGDRRIRTLEGHSTIAVGASETEGGVRVVVIDEGDC